MSESVNIAGSGIDLADMFGIKNAAAETTEAIPLNAVENVFYFLGLTTPTKRFMAGFALAEALIFLGKPSWSFTSDGKLRPWSVLNTKSKVGTQVPWWLPGLILGSSLSIFI
jgi:hypothetical protein